MTKRQQHVRQIPHGKDDEGTVEVDESARTYAQLDEMKVGEVTPKTSSADNDSDK